MDPLSLTTGGITLFQTVFEIAKFAKDLKESFSQASRNDKNAQLLIDELLEKVTFIESYYKQHKTLLDDLNAKPSLDILLQLRDALAEVISECEKLKRPEKPANLVARTKMAFRSWRDGDDVEARIRAFCALAKQCQDKFRLFVDIINCGLLIEVRDSVVTRPRSRADQPCVTCRTVREPSEAPEPSAPSVADTSKVHTFVPTTSPGVPRSIQLSPERVTDILRCQAADLDGLLSGILTSGQVLIPKPGDFDESRSHRVVTIRHATTYEILQQHLLSQTCDLRCILADPSSLSADSRIHAANSLLQISEAYHHTLRLPQEANTLSSWAVFFYRQAYQAYPDTYKQLLAHSLTTSAVQLLQCDDEPAATTNIVEALRLYRDILSTDPSPINKINLAKALTVSVSIAEVGGSGKTFDEHDTESIELLEHVLVGAYGTMAVEEIPLHPESFKRTRTVIEIADWRVQALLAYGYAQSQRITDEGMAIAQQIFLKFHQYLPGAFSHALVNVPYRWSFMSERMSSQPDKIIQILSKALIHLDSLPVSPDDLTHTVLKYSLSMDYAYHSHRLLSNQQPPAEFPALTAMEAYNAGRVCAEGIIQAIGTSKATHDLPITSETRCRLPFAIRMETSVLSKLHGGPSRRWYNSQGNPSTTYSPSSAREADHSLHSRHAAIQSLVDEISERARQFPQTLTNGDYNTAFLLLPIVHKRLVKLEKLEEASQVAWKCAELARCTPKPYRAQAQNRSLVMKALFSIASTQSKRHLPHVIHAIADVTHILLPTPMPREHALAENILVEFASCIRNTTTPAAMTESLKQYLVWFSQTKPVGAKRVEKIILDLTATLAQRYLSMGKWSAALECTGPLLEAFPKMSQHSVGSEPLRRWLRSKPSLFVAVVVFHVTALQHLGRLAEAIGCVADVISHFSHDGNDSERRWSTKSLEDVNRATTDSTGQAEDVDHGHGAGEELGWRLIFPSDLNNYADNKRSSDSWGLALLSMHAFLVSQGGEYSRATTLASDARRTTKPPFWKRVNGAPRVVAVLYPRMWTDLSRAFADGRSPDEAMNCACRAMGAVADNSLDDFDGPVFLYQIIDSGIVLASTAILLNLHIEDASKLLLQQVDMCQGHLPERRDLYLLYAVAMRLLSFYNCGVGDHDEGMRWKRKVGGLEGQLEDVEGRNGEVFGAVRRRITWEEGRPSTQEIKKILNVQCDHQNSVFNV